MRKNLKKNGSSDYLKHIVRHYKKQIGRSIDKIIRQVER